MPSIPSKLYLQKHHIYPIPHTHTFSLWNNLITSKVLIVLILINIQAKSDVNLGGQEMVITNQGVAIQPCFHASKTYVIYKTGHWVVFIKIRTETCIKGWDWTCRLRSLRGSPVLRGRGRGTGPRSPAHRTARWRALLRSLRGLQHTPTSTQSIQDLSLSSNRNHIKYRDRSDIFEWFGNSAARNYNSSDMVRFGVNRSCFGAWNSRFCKGSGADKGSGGLVVTNPEEVGPGCNF